MDEVRSYWQVASISHFCTLFGKIFKLPTFEPEELEQAFILNIPEPNKEDESSELQQQLQEEQLNSQPQPEHQEIHLLVKLGIALLKPHYTTKLTPTNWENYLRRLIETNWVELEHHPSPFRFPIISSEGVELTKNLTFNELPLSDKIDVFYALCDYRFWCDDASDAIQDIPIEELRLESLGKDAQGYEYYYFSGVRLYREDRELFNDLILRKKRIKELEYTLFELEKTRILKEQEEKRKADLEKARQIANEAREASLVAKRQQDLEKEKETAAKRRKNNTPILPPRTGLRERRSSAMSNTNESTPSRATRSRAAKDQQSHNEETDGSQQQSTQKPSRGSARNSRLNSNQAKEVKVEEPKKPKKSPEEECREELDRIAIKPEDRAAAWSIQCEALEDWESFVAKFDKSKSTNERYLFHALFETILPNIRAIYAKRAAEVRRKEKEILLSLASRRVSTRIISKRAQEEEEERRQQAREVELQKKKAEAESRLRAELEREMRAKKNRFVINGGTSSCSEDGDDHNSRYNLRYQSEYDLDSHDFDGIIHPDKLSEFYEALELVIDTVRTSKHAWPFVDPVPETVPGYYDLIDEPMDLKRLRTKVEFREYKSLLELETDFQLLVNNCERFNGPKNVYTKMVHKLWRSFRKNVKLYLQRDLHMNEQETFLYPPPAPVPIEQDANNDHHGANDEQQNGIGGCEAIVTETYVADTNDERANGISSHEELIEETPSTEAVDERQNGTDGREEIIIDTNAANTIDVRQNGAVVSEEIIIDTYAAPCPDDDILIWNQEIEEPMSGQNP